MVQIQSQRHFYKKDREYVSINCLVLQQYIAAAIRDRLTVPVLPRKQIGNKINNVTVNLLGLLCIIFKKIPNLIGVTIDDPQRPSYIFFLDRITRVLYVIGFFNDMLHILLLFLEHFKVYVKHICNYSNALIFYCKHFYFYFNIVVGRFRHISSYKHIN